MAELLLKLRFPAQAGEMRNVRKSLRNQLVELDCNDGFTQDVVLAVDEACQNVIRHAYGKHRQGEIELEIERDGQDLVIRLVDWAPRTDPSKVRPRELDDVRPGGLGTHFIQTTMDSAEFVDPPPPGCGNLLRMVKRLP